jgi:hypothetical protein
MAKSLPANVRWLEVGEEAEREQLVTENNYLAR